MSDKAIGDADRFEHGETCGSRYCIDMDWKLNIVEQSRQFVFEANGKTYGVYRGLIPKPEARATSFEFRREYRLLDRRPVRLGRRDRGRARVHRLGGGCLPHRRAPGGRDHGWCRRIAEVGGEVTHGGGVRGERHNAHRAPSLGATQG